MAVLESRIRLPDRARRVHPVVVRGRNFDRRQCGWQAKHRLLHEDVLALNVHHDDEAHEDDDQNRSQEDDEPWLREEVVHVVVVEREAVREGSVELLGKRVESHDDWLTVRTRASAGNSSRAHGVSDSLGEVGEHD